MIVSVKLFHAVGEVEAYVTSVDRRKPTLPEVEVTEQIQPKGHPSLVPVGLECCRAMANQTSRKDRDNSHRAAPMSASYRYTTAATHPSRRAQSRW